LSEASNPREERETSGAHSVLRGTVLLAGSRILDRASTFVIVLLIAPRFGAAGVGAYSTAMAIYGLFTMAGLAGTTNYLVREISRDKSRTSTYMTHLSVMALGLALILLVVMELIVPHLGYSPVVRDCVEIVLLGMPGTVLNGIQEAAFLAHRRVEFETLTTLVSAITYIGVGAFLMLDHHSVQSLMWTYIALEYIATIVYFILISKFIARLRAAFDRRLAWRLMVEMKTFTASSLVQAVFIRPEVVILSLMASATQVGYYGAAVRVAELPQFLPEVFMANVFTLMSAAYPENEKRFREIQAKAVRSMLAFAMPLTALILGAAPGIIHVLFGSRFHRSVDVLRILSLSVLFASLMAVYWRSLSARGRQDLVLRVQIEMIALRLGGGAALIAPFAAIGAAIATTVNSAIQMLLLIVGAARNGARTPIIGPTWRLGLAAVACGAVTWLVDDWVNMWVALPAGAAAYVLAAIVFRAVSAEDRELLARLRSPAAARS
jgi:O-antigen/teichoic acid export membrane protein